MKRTGIVFVAAAMVVIGAACLVFASLVSVVDDGDKPKSVTVKDIEETIRAARAPDVTELQKEEILKRLIGSILTITGKVLSVPASKETSIPITLEYASEPRVGKQPTISAVIRLVMKREEAMKLKKGEAFTVRGTISYFDNGGWNEREGGIMNFSVSLSKWIRLT